jgi:SAM-dependent methyltransferase
MKTSKKGESSFEGSDTSADMENLDLYEASSKYYDIWHEEFREDIDFYLKLAAKTGGPVLELMSGTGRVLVPFAQAGYDITGVDRSPSMLDVCTTRLSFLEGDVQQRIDVVQGDVRTIKLDKKFKLVVMPFNSFLHLLETEDQVATLKNVLDHLEKGGLFSFAIFNPRLDRPVGLLRHRGTKLTAQGEVISWFESQTFDAPNERTTVHYFYDISRQDRPLRRVTSKFTLRYLFHREVVALLKQCGFELAQAYGDYEGSEFSAISERMVYVARKP